MCFLLSHYIFLLLTYTQFFSSVVFLTFSCCLEKCCERKLYESAKSECNKMVLRGKESD